MNQIGGLVCGHFRRFGALLSLGMSLSMACAAAVPSSSPVGVTYYDPAKTYNSYVLFSSLDGRTHLIDMMGNEVHRWDYQGFPSELLDPAITGGKRGNLLVQLSTIEGAATGIAPGIPALFKNKEVGEISWDGHTVWHWGAEAPGGAARQHHDWERLAKGNTLLLVNAPRALPGFTLKEILDDGVYEVSANGKIVWQWFIGDHLEEVFNPEALKLVKATASLDYLHVNDMTSVGPNKWFDAGDKRFAPANVLIESRDANVIAIIDKKSGKIVWRMGPDYSQFDLTKQKTPHAVDQVSGPHDAHLIPKGLPGAGNLLLFDNQGEAGFPPVALNVWSGSRVLEIDPTTMQVVWQYSAVDSDRPLWEFFSPFISSARRLPNGNTLIDEGIKGRFLQVTPSGEIVWEYINPYGARTPIGALVGRTVLSNAVYRAQPVPYEWVPTGTPHAEKAASSTEPTPPNQ